MEVETMSGKPGGTVEEAEKESRDIAERLSTCDHRQLQESADEFVDLLNSVGIEDANKGQEELYSDMVFSIRRSLRLMERVTLRAAIELREKGGSCEKCHGESVNLGGGTRAHLWRGDCKFVGFG
jgi:hypothetical protein